MKKISEMSVAKIPLSVRLVRIVMELIGFGLTLIPSFLTLYLTDHMIGQNRNIPYYWIAAVIALCFLIHLLVFYFVRYMEQVYVNAVASDFRSKIGEKIAASKMPDYEKQPKSKVFNILNDMTPVYTLANYLICVPVDLIEVIVVVGLMFYAHAGLGIISILMAPLYLISSYLNKGKLERLVSDERKALDAWQQEVDILINHKVSIGLNRSFPFMLSCYRKTMGNFYSAQNRKHFYLLLTMELPRLITTLAPLLILIAGGNLVVAQQLTLGTLLFALQLIGYLFTPLGEIAMIQADLMSQKTNFRRSKDFMALPDEENDLPGSDVRTIHLKDVTLMRADQTPLFTIEDFFVKGPGLVVIKGENGCGKSTLFNVISGVFSEAQMRSGNDSIVEISSEYRNHLGYLFYPNFIFPGTVKENVLCGRDVSPQRFERIHTLLNMPPADKEVKTKPENLSLGEKQKIYLARLLLSDDACQFFDEPGSNLDDKTEKSLISEIGRMKQTKLIIVISHNALYDDIADWTYVIKGGRMTLKGCRAD